MSCHHITINETKKTINPDVSVSPFYIDFPLEDIAFQQCTPFMVLLGLVRSGIPTETKFTIWQQPQPRLVFGLCYNKLFWCISKQKETITHQLYCFLPKCYNWLPMCWRRNSSLKLHWEAGREAAQGRKILTWMRTCFGDALTHKDYYVIGAWTSAIWQRWGGMVN